MKDVVLTANNEEQVIQPVPRYDTSAIDVKAEDTLGYIIFAEDLPSPGLTNPPTVGTEFTVTKNGCRLAPDVYVSCFMVVAEIFSREIKRRVTTVCIPGRYV